MFVRSVMMPKSECHFAEGEESLQEVLDTFDKYDIEGMPVVEQGKYKGMITKQRIYEYYFEVVEENKQLFLENHRVNEVLSNENIYVYKDEVFESAFTTLKGAPIIAVIDHDKTFLGIVTRYDVIEQFESVFGMKKRGTRITFSTTEQEGVLYRLTNVIRSHQVNVISLTTFDETGKLARRIVLKIDTQENSQKFIDELEKNGFRILDVKEL
ncbi:CBS domain-containing protein [Allobacillus sp. GCM10007491]|uniref:CBS domain-containing protein n=1 Tax=Allobacillus saliphilus TaxID=2912308 RepID=A0A941CW51_9BACI|nr:CBS domain-containing protein [Allobacillus saliphilus]